MNTSPVSSIAGTKTTATTHSEGSSRRSRRPTAGPPERSSDAAISDPARANMTDMAGKTSVSEASPVTW